MVELQAGRRAVAPSWPTELHRATAASGWRATSARGRSTSSTHLPRQDNGKIYKRQLRETSTEKGRCTDGHL